MTESPITSKRDTRKKDSAPRGVFCHRSGVWAVRFTCGAGHIHQEKVGPLKGDAIRIYYERRAQAYDEPGWCPAVERARARERAAKDKTSQPLTFNEARDRYLTMKESEKKRSISDDRQNLGRLIAWFGPTTPLTEITAGRISDYRVSRANEMSRRRGGQPVSNATVNRELATLRHLLRLAHEEWEALDKVPVVKMLKEPQGRLRWLGQCAPDEETRLIAACGKSANVNLVKIATVALETGMRQGEVMGLAWERVDFSRGVIRLELTKSGRRREVPMRQAVYDALAPLRAEALAGLGAGQELHGRVWPDRRFPRKAWETALEGSGVEDFHFHDTRHHFASWFMMRGGGLLALKEILGHRDTKMTQRYAHLAPDHLRAEMEKTAAIPRSDIPSIASGLAEAETGLPAVVELRRNFDDGQAEAPSVL